jgi:lambda family phage portal protein
MVTMDNKIVDYMRAGGQQIKPLLRESGRRLGNAVSAIFGGESWHGASLRRGAMAGWRPNNGDADAATLWDLAELRRRSRDSARNNPIAGGAINANVTNVIGTGLSCQPTINYELLGLSEEEADAWQTQTAANFVQWFESMDCDITRHQNGYGLQALAFRSMLESGDVVVTMPIVNVSGIGEMLTIQIIEADRLSNPWNVADTATLAGGVEKDDNGAPAYYHICNQHPGSRVLNTTLRKWEKIPAFGAQTGRRNVLHVFERRRPGQSRGVPYLAPVMEPLKQLGRYTDAEISAAVNSAAISFFTRMDPEAFGDIFDDKGREAYVGNAKSWDGSIPQSSIDGPGKAVNLLPGESVEMMNPGRPNDKFDPFVMAVLRQVGVSLELPFEVLVKHFESSYSAARAALLDAWKFFKCRREFIATHLCQPIYENWLAYEIANGSIAAPGYFVSRKIAAAYNGSVWIGDGPGSIDPLKEVQAAGERIDLGISTKQAESIAYDGIPWELKLKQRAKEAREEKAAGLVTPEKRPIIQAPPDNKNEE